MKRFSFLIIAVFVSLSLISSYADNGYSLDVALCYDGDAYSADYVFDVPAGVQVLSVSVNDENCYFDWNYVESEARLYISLASGSVIAKSKAIAKISLSSEVESLDAASVTVNGRIKKDVYAYHSPETVGAVPPGVNTPGESGDIVCEVCGVLLEESHPVYPPTSPIAPGDVNGDGKITRPDLIRLTQYFANWDVVIDEHGADTTGDGKITRPDLIRLTQYFANWDVKLGE